MPSGRTLTNIGSATRIVAGKYLPRASYEAAGPYPVFGSNSLMGFASAPLVNLPCVVMASVGANAGAVRLSPTPSWVNNNAFALMPSDAGLTVEFLYLWLDRALDRAAIRAGTGQPYVKRDALRAQPIHYPSIGEQRRIADLAAAVDAVRDSAAEGGRQGRMVLDALAEDLFEDADLGPPRRLDDLLRRGNGLSYGVLKPGDFVDEGVPLVRGQNIRDGAVVLDELVRVTPDVARDYGRTTLLGGEVLLTVVGRIGYSAVVPEVLSHGNVSRAVAVARLGAGVSPEYLSM